MIKRRMHRCKWPDCAHQEEDLSGEMFFVQMARAHATEAQEQNGLSSRIAGLQKAMAQQQEEDARAYRITLNIGRNQ